MHLLLTGMASGGNFTNLLFCCHSWWVGQVSATKDLSPAGGSRCEIQSAPLSLVTLQNPHLIASWPQKTENCSGCWHAGCLLRAWVTSSSVLIRELWFCGLPEFCENFVVSFLLGNRPSLSGGWFEGFNHVTMVIAKQRNYYDNKKGFGILVAHKLFGIHNARYQGPQQCLKP